MNFRNFLALALLVVALILAFMPWKPSSSSPSSSSPQTLQSPSSPTPSQNSSNMDSPKLSSPQGWWALILAHRKTAGFLIVCLMVVVGIGMARRFFDKI